MPSFTSYAVLALAALSSFTQAAPVDLSERIVPVSKCTTLYKGLLKTSNGLPLNIIDKTLHYTTGANTLEVEFQSCQPNFGGYDGKDGRPVGGHIYVPSAKKVLTTSNTGAGPPFTFELAAAEFSDDSSQVFSNFIRQSDGKIYYVGGTQADGSYIFFGDQCKSGYFGVPSSVTTTPTPFKCVNQAHIVGLNID